MSNRAMRRPALQIVALCVLSLGLVVSPLPATKPVEAGRCEEQPGPYALALVYVPLDAPGRLGEVRAAGLIPFERLRGPDGEFLLAGARLASGQSMPQVGFPLRVLDPDTSQGDYYLAAVPPGSAAPEWTSFGALLYADAAQALLRMRPGDAERLAAEGAELAQLSLSPAVVEPEQPGEPLVRTILTTPDPVVQQMVNQVTSAALQSYDAQLSGETTVIVGGVPYTITTRHTDSGVPIANATQLVGEHLAALGYAVEYQAWSKSGHSNRNVIGQRTGAGRPNDIYIIGAHLDDMPGGGSAPGADDNGSGSAAALLAADILSQYSWDCTLRFAFWTGEEQGLLGSAVYAARSKSAGETIKGYLNLDMLGYNSAPPPELNLFWKSTVPGSKAMADLFVDVVSTYGLDLAPYEYDAFTYTIGDYSDNKSFWDQGYPAILAIEDYYGDSTPYYHRATDQLSTLDMAYFTSMTKAAVGTFVHASGCLGNPTPVTVRGLTATSQSRWYAWLVGAAVVTGVVAWFRLRGGSRRRDR